MWVECCWGGRTQRVVSPRSMCRPILTFFIASTCPTHVPSGAQAALYSSLVLPSPLSAARPLLPGPSRGGAGFAETSMRPPSWAQTRLSSLGHQWGRGACLVLSGILVIVVVLLSWLRGPNGPSGEAACFECADVSATSSPSFAVLFAVVSHCANRESRDLIRSTWAQSAQSLGMVVRFFVSSKPECEAPVAAEQAEFGDLEFVPIEERYDFLPQKTLHVFRRAGAMAPVPQVLVKVDDDNFVDIPRFLGTLRANPSFRLRPGVP